MPPTLTASAWLTVTDSEGRTLRCEELKAGADVGDRLRLAHRVYQTQGWCCDPLLPARWSFIAETELRRIVIAIQRIRPGALPQSRRSAASR